MAVKINQKITKVSEEETFEDNKALWWSPDSSRLVYGVFDDTNVDILLLPRLSTFVPTS